MSRPMRQPPSEATQVGSPGIPGAWVATLHVAGDDDPTEISLDDRIMLPYIVRIHHFAAVFW